MQCRSRGDHRYASDTSFVQLNASKGRQFGVIGGFEAFGAAAMAISEGRFCEDDSGTCHA